MSDKNTTIERDPDVIDTFTIPEELASEMSELLTKSTIRRTLLIDLVGNQAKYEEMEKMLIPIEDRLTTLKNMVTMKYVPEKYCSESFIWNFPYYLNTNEVWIKRN